MKVLIAENNKTTLDFISDLFQKEGFEVILAQNGGEAIKEYHNSAPDFVCLDILMPDISGYDVCREIRKNDDQIPIIFISTKNNPFDKAIGLELGADDYIEKPFNAVELLARVRAVARRCFKKNKTNQELNESFSMGDIEIFPQKLKAKRGDVDIDLSLRDINILKILYENKNNVVSKDVLLDLCWGAHIMPESRTVAWHISQLRKRIEKKPSNPKIIKTVHGLGYRYDE